MVSCQPFVDRECQIGIMSIRPGTSLTAVWLATAMASAACRAPSASPSPEAASVRQQLERQYELNRQAFLKEDLEAIMAMRTDDFHTVGPDNQTRDRAAMREYTEGLLNGIERWNELTFTIDSLEVVGDEARAIVRQHLDRMALRPDGKVHHVETWATQRESGAERPPGGSCGGWTAYVIGGGWWTGRRSRASQGVRVAPTFTTVTGLSCT
jgi:ketosteroid isomerase-like protein